ncbi:MAG TPA: Na+/H+ antiporter NhaA [Candidatus Kapabacteria bacterium]|nr:Na+/H+ antiporter NhaA [Candidatus Kapabacteria bacterium]
MSEQAIRKRLSRPVDQDLDHTLGVPSAEITLLEYGSYACPHCRAANDRIAEVRDEFGGRLRYVFRHRPIPGNELAERAAVLAERASQKNRFWEAHAALMGRSAELTEDDLKAVAAEHGLNDGDFTAERNAKLRVDQDRESARTSGVEFTPTFFVNARLYEGLWEEAEFREALLRPLGHRVRSAALDFARWAPSAGILLLLATVLAVIVTNSGLGPRFAALWDVPFGFRIGSVTFSMSILHWVNDALLTIFFLVVGLEIKREFTVGHLASRRSAALPIFAAIGGMVGPIVLYKTIIPSGPWGHGWGVPMATDTAFAVAIIIMMGSRVPVELRIFLTAAAIVDDIGAIVVVALFYSHELHWGYLVGAAGVAGLLGLLNHFKISRVLPYVLLGSVLWAMVHAGGLHATLAGVVLAFFVPTREPPNFRALLAQADAILISEAQHTGEKLRHGPSGPALEALDAIHDRIESPADRLLRSLSLRSNYVVLPLFALANAGVALNPGVLHSREPIVLAVMMGLVIGKPLGMVAFSALGVRLGIATKPEAYTWRQLAGAGALGGIGFTMSLFIASEAFPENSDFAAAKLAIFSASIASAIIGVTVLWRSNRSEPID